MSEASGYLLGDIEDVLNNARKNLKEHLTVGSFRIKGREKAEKYKKELSNCMEKLEEIVASYPGDKEVNDFYNKFSSFYVEQREKESYAEEDRKKLDKLIENIREIAQWRKMEHAAGENLPFGDYRRMRESYRKR